MFDLNGCPWSPLTASGHGEGGRSSSVHRCQSHPGLSAVQVFCHSRNLGGMGSGSSHIWWNFLGMFMLLFLAWIKLLEAVPVPLARPVVDGVCTCRHGGLVVCGVVVAV